MKQSCPNCQEINAPIAGVTGNRARFTIDGSIELEDHLVRICEKVLHGVLRVAPAERLEALFLGGGYGRGEGGVLETAAGHEPYNDLEFYVCLRGPDWWNERRYQAPLHGLGEKLSPFAGVDVEFKILSLHKLRHSPPSMFYYDLVARHHRLWGIESSLAGCDHHRNSERIPLAEATRLLMNRCSGLLFAREQLRRGRFTPEEADFVGRNHAKAQLALGDVILTAQGQYHWSCRERARRMESIACNFARLPEAKMHHTAGVQFKLHPQRTVRSRDFLSEQQQIISSLAQQLWLWLEGQRLESPFATTQNYAMSSLPKCPETKRWRNFLVNLKTFGPTVIFSNQADRYPRERLLEALPLLLWAPETLSDQRFLRKIQEALGSPARDWAQIIEAYHSLWRQFR